MSRNAVAYGFRDDVTDEELAQLMKDDVVSECLEHGVLEEKHENTLDAAVAKMRKEPEPSWWDEQTLPDGQPLADFDPKAAQEHGL